MKTSLSALFILTLFLAGCGGWQANAGGSGPGYDVYRPEPYLLIVFGTIADGSTAKPASVNDANKASQNNLSTVEDLANRLNPPGGVAATKEQLEKAVDGAVKAEVDGLTSKLSSSITDANTAMKSQGVNDSKLAADLAKLKKVIDDFNANPVYTQAAVTALLKNISDALKDVITDSATPQSAGYTAKIVYLPDYASRYRITSSQSILGSAESQFTFTDGWELTSIDSKSDNSAALTAIASIVGSLTGGGSSPKGSGQDTGNGSGKKSLLAEKPAIEQSFVLYKFIYNPQGYFLGLKKVEPDALASSPKLGDRFTPPFWNSIETSAPHQ